MKALLSPLLPIFLMVSSCNLTRGPFVLILTASTRARGLRASGTWSEKHHSLSLAVVAWACHVGVFQNGSHGNISRGWGRSWLGFTGRIISLLQNSLGLLLLLRACLPFGLLLTAVNIFQQLGLQSLNQHHQVIAISSLLNLSSFPLTIFSQLDNTSCSLKLGCHLKQTLATQQPNRFSRWSFQSAHQTHVKRLQGTGQRREGLQVPIFWQWVPCQAASLPFSYQWSHLI